MLGRVCDEECDEEFMMKNVWWRVCDEEGKCVMSSVRWRVLLRVCDGECVMESVWRRVFEGEFVMKSDEAGQVISFMGKILVQSAYQRF